MLLCLAYAIGQVGFVRSQPEGSRKSTDNTVDPEIFSKTDENAKVKLEPIAGPNLGEHLNPKNVPNDADARRLVASGFGASLATACGYESASMIDHLEHALGQRNTTDRFNLVDEQLTALSQLERRCSQFLGLLESDSSLMSQVKQSEESLGRFYDALMTGIGSNGWSDSLRTMSLDSLSSENPAEMALGAMHLMMYDRATQKAVARYLGTDDLGYVERMSPAVAMLMECKLEGTCGPDSFSALRSCVMADAAFCNGIEQGLSTTRSYGQYADIMTVANVLVDLLRNQ